MPFTSQSENSRPLNTSPSDTRINPLAGLLASAAGTLFAIALMPDHPYEGGALMTSSAALTIGLLFVPAFAIAKNYFSVFRAETILMVGLVYWLLLDLLQGSLWLYVVDYQTIEKTFAMIGVFAIGIWLGVCVYRPNPTRLVRSLSDYDPAPNHIFYVIIACFLLGMFWFFNSCDWNMQCMVDSLRGGRFNRPWLRSRLGGWDSFAEHTRYFGYLLPVLTVLLRNTRGRVNWQVVAALAMSAVFVIYLIRGGGRKEVGAVLVAAITAWALLRRQLAIWDMARLFAAVIVVLWLLQTMFVYRNIGYENMFSDDPLVRAAVENVYAEDSVKVDRNFQHLAQMIGIVPEKHEYVYEKQLIFVLVRPIPRALWPEKPAGRGFDLPTYLGKRNTLTTSVVGDWYVIAGWVSVLIGGAVTGIVGGFANAFFQFRGSKWSRLWYALFMMPLFLGLRAMQEMVVMSYPVLGLIAIFLLGKLLQKRRLQRESIGYEPPEACASNS